MQLSVKDIADNANMIINGYAYTKDSDYIRILNLNCLNIMESKFWWVVLGMCRHSPAYNTYATISYTNPLFMGVSGYQNVNSS